jgi:hypothetical protein
MPRYRGDPTVPTPLHLQLRHRSCSILGLGRSHSSNGRHFTTTTSPAVQELHRGAGPPGQGTTLRGEPQRSWKHTSAPSTQHSSHHRRTQAAVAAHHLRHSRRTQQQQQPAPPSPPPPHTAAAAARTTFATTTAHSSSSSPHHLRHHRRAQQQQQPVPPCPAAAISDVTSPRPSSPTSLQ